MNHDAAEEDSLTEKLLQLILDTHPQSIEQLVEVATRETALPRETVVAQVLTLQSQGKIRLMRLPETPPRRLRTYLKTEAATWYWITLLTAAATTIAVFAIPADAYPFVYLRYVLGAIFVLWLPGYCFVRALFPAVPVTTQASLDAIERLALSMGMSLALVPLVGLLLNYTPWGIRLAPIVMSLLLLTVAFATAAVLREHHERLARAQEVT